MIVMSLKKFDNVCKGVGFKHLNKNWRARLTKALANELKEKYEACSPL